MEIIQHETRVFTPNIRPKLDQSAEIAKQIEEFLAKGGEITRDSRPTAFVSQFGKKPAIAPKDTAVWHQKDEVLRLMRKHKILTKKISGKMRLPFSQIEAYLKGLRCPCKETQERIAATLDLLIINKGKDD